MSVAIFLGAIASRAGGMETYEVQFLRALAQQDRERAYDVYCLRRQAAQMLGVDQPNFNIITLPINFRPLNVGLTMPALLAMSRARLVHPTYVPPFFCSQPYVYTIHSAVTWTHPEYYPKWIRWRLNSLQEKGIREARKLLCVSRYVRDFIASEFRVPEDRLEVVYHGVSSRFFPRPVEKVKPLLKDRYKIDYPYFLFVGKLTANKNIYRLLRAFQRFREQTRSDLRLVLAGRRLWSKGALDAHMDRAVASGAVIEIGHVDQEDMAPLYCGSRGLVFPSLHEGFGLPVLEAFACGIPVLTSNNSSFPEVTGGHAVLVNELSVDDIADGMRRLAEDEALRAKLICEGAAWVKSFTWENAARQIRSIYDQVLTPS
jgi:alpha-1,3-rhamnosyl/mannosyltransferase